LTAWLLVPVALLGLWIVLAMLHDLDQYFRVARYEAKLDRELDGE